KVEYDLLDADIAGGPASLLVIEWKFKPEGSRLHICNPSGFSRHHLQLKLQRFGIEYTAYLRTPLANEWQEANRFSFGELDPEVQALVDLAKTTLRSHIRKRLSEHASTVIEEWKNQSISPYAVDPLDPLSQA